jgi:hypothetical protein
MTYKEQAADKLTCLTGREQKTSRSNSPNHMSQSSDRANVINNLLSSQRNETIENTSNSLVSDMKKPTYGNPANMGLLPETQSSRQAPSVSLGDYALDEDDYCSIWADIS